MPVQYSGLLEPPLNKMSPTVPDRLPWPVVPLPYHSVTPDPDSVMILRKLVDCTTCVPRTRAVPVEPEPELVSWMRPRAVESVEDELTRMPFPLVSAFAAIDMPTPVVRAATVMSIIVPVVAPDWVIVTKPVPVYTPVPDMKRATPVVRALPNMLVRVPVVVELPTTFRRPTLEVEVYAPVWVMRASPFVAKFEAAEELVTTKAEPVVRDAIPALIRNAMPVISPVADTPTRVPAVVALPTNCMAADPAADEVKIPDAVATRTPELAVMAPVV